MFLSLSCTFVLVALVSWFLVFLLYFVLVILLLCLSRPLVLLLFLWSCSCLVFFFLMRSCSCGHMVLLSLSHNGIWSSTYAFGIMISLLQACTLLVFVLCYCSCVLVLLLRSCSCTWLFGIWPLVLLFYCYHCYSGPNLWSYLALVIMLIYIIMVLYFSLNNDEI